MQIGLIGFGAIGQEIAARLSSGQYGVRLAGVLLKPNSPSAAAAKAVGIEVVESATQLSHLGVSWAIECAGHSALSMHGPAVLEQGMSLLVASIGALADDHLKAQLDTACRQYRGAGELPYVSFCSGALGGLDALSGARHSPPLEVTYISEKPIHAWRGTAAETMIDLDQVKGTAVFFTGSARQAALQFPQNANVAAAVAFAGVGLDNTNVKLCAVEGQSVNRHQVIAHGSFGHMHCLVEGKPLERNPKTSVLAATSLLEATINVTRQLRLV